MQRARNAVERRFHFQLVFYLFVLSAASLLLAGCVQINGIPTPSNMSITIQTPNVTIQTQPSENAANGTQLNISQAPSNLTVCVVGLETNASDGLFNGNFTFASRNFSFTPQYYNGDGSFGDCNLFVFKGDSVGVYSSMSQRTALLKGIGDGVSLMFDRLALSQVQDDPTVDGWEFMIANAIPVQKGAAGHELVIPANKTISREFKFRNYYDVWNGFKNFQVQNLLIFETLPSDNAIVVADFSEPSPTGASDVAITAKQASGLSGRAVYFSFDAFDSSDQALQGMSRQAVVFLLQDFLHKRFIA